MGRVREYYSLVDDGDIGGLIELFAPDAVYHRPGYEPMQGRADLERFYRTQRVIREGSHTITAIIQSGADVAVRGEFRGVLNDGRATSLRFADFFSLSPDGRFARRNTFFFAPLV
ncbi:nuclear transport factor 2 family protein [Streptomyces sp. NBC_00190]|uniref:nuclear transport factor 2 family protein n=1 Tax=unclassified Streptomyces TaxID=2593676 RepID=UPI002E2BF900|nr:nuclear transport factor 2 family protein [Streptomyces sp. NBC_00190]WSZ37622.1 nuclear transport factor 2 family protein [Streptomyces sp. NBC_00868]